MLTRWRSDSSRNRMAEACSRERVQWMMLRGQGHQSVIFKLINELPKERWLCEPRDAAARLREARSPRLLCTLPILPAVVTNPQRMAIESVSLPFTTVLIRCSISSCAVSQPSRRLLDCNGNLAWL